MINTKQRVVKWNKKDEAESKKKTLEERHRIKSEAMELSKTAKTIEEKTMYLRRTAEIDSYIIDSSIELLNLMGIRTIKAPAEGEAQAARLNANGLVYAVASQDYDTILFGANRIVRNLNITNRKKVTGKGISTTVSPELIEAKKFFSETGLDREKAILIAMMVGTDYNKGVMGIGPKKALKIVKEETREQILSKYDFRTENDVNEVYNYFISPNVVDYKELSNQRLLLEFWCFAVEYIYRSYLVCEKTQGPVEKAVQMGRYPPLLVGEVGAVGKSYRR